MIDAIDQAWLHLKEAKDLFTQVEQSYGAHEPHERDVHRGARELARECDRLLRLCERLEDDAELAA